MDLTWTPPNKAKASAAIALKEIREESARMTDSNVKNEKTRAVLLIGLSDKDYEVLQVLAAHNPRIKNYGVLVRKVLKAEAKRCSSGP